MDSGNEPIRVDTALSERLQEYASEAGVSVQEAFEAALGLGLETLVSDSARMEGRVRDLERRVADLFSALHTVGPAVLGVRALLVGWAAKEAFGVDEDELMAELDATGRSEWELSLAERGLVVPGVSRAAEG